VTEEIVATALWRWLAPRLRRAAPPLLIGHLLGLGAYALGVQHAHDGIDASLFIGHSSRPPNDSWSGLYGWDADSYTAIAQDGYPTAPGDHLDAFLPLYPVLIRILMVPGIDAAVAGVLVSLVAQCVALIAVDMLVTRERDGGTGLFAMWLLALAPMGIFMDVAYTESTFMAATAVSLYLARRGRLAGASVAAMVAGATRITGVALIPVLLVVWVSKVARRGSEGVLVEWRELGRLPLVGLPLLPFALFSLYLGAHTGNIDSYHLAQTGSSFNHDIAWPWTGFLADWNQLTPGSTFYDTWWREVAYGVCGVALCAGGWLDPSFSRTLALYCTVALLISTSISFWLSVPRYLLALFPLIIVFADLTERTRWARPIIVLGSGWLFLWSGYTFGTGAWVA
jgi:hypothetical protein